MKVCHPLSLSIAACAAVGLCGCPNPDLYTTPRTLDPGTVQWQVAPELIGVAYDVTDAAGNKSTATATVPMVPSFGARIGLADGFDLGLHLQNLDSLEADGKIRLLKGTFDLALDPGIQGYYVSVSGTSLGVAYLHVPVLLGLNLSEKSSLVLTPGIVYSVATASVNDGSGATGVASETGLWARAGVGLDYRISPKFAIHPELTFMDKVTGSSALIWVGGFGFNIGAQPDYSDLGKP